MTLRSVLWSLLAVLALAVPQLAVAQPTTTQSDEPCEDFGWLLGTWNSYSPWGDQTEPTGGTLVFTIGSAGTLEGRIGVLNDHMEEVGYTAGQLVYRGHREVRYYGPEGTTVYESFDGEYFDIGRDGAQWREESIGVRPSGILYQSPPAFGDFGGPYRKAGSTQTSGRCAPSTQEPTPPASEYTQSPIVQSLTASPVLLTPGLVSLLDCLEAGGQPVAPNDTERSAIDVQIDTLESLVPYIADPQADGQVRASHIRNYVRIMNEVVAEYHATAAARMLETDPQRRASLDRKLRAIDSRIQIRGEQTNEEPQFGTDDGPSDWELRRDYHTDEADSLRNRMLRSQQEEIDDEEESERLACRIRELINMDLAPVEEYCPDVVDVRSTGSRLAYPQRGDVDSLVERATTSARTLQTMALDDPVLPALAALYLETYSKLRAERAGFARLAAEDTTPELRETYLRRAREIGEALEQLPYISPPNEGYDLEEMQRVFPHAPTFEDFFPEESLDTMLERALQRSPSTAELDAFANSDAARDVRGYLTENNSLFDAPVFQDAEGYYVLPVNEAEADRRCDALEQILQDLPPGPAGP